MLDFSQQGTSLNEDILRLIVKELHSEYNALFDAPLEAYSADGFAALRHTLFDLCLISRTFRSITQPLFGGRVADIPMRAAGATDLELWPSARVIRLSPQGAPKSDSDITAVLQFIITATANVQPDAVIVDLLDFVLENSDALPEISPSSLSAPIFELRAYSRDQDTFLATLACLRLDRWNLTSLDFRISETVERHFFALTPLVISTSLKKLSASYGGLEGRENILHTHATAMTTALNNLAHVDFVSLPVPISFIDPVRSVVETRNDHISTIEELGIGADASELGRRYASAAANARVLVVWLRALLERYAPMFNLPRKVIWRWSSLRGTWFMACSPEGFTLVDGFGHVYNLK